MTIQGEKIALVLISKIFHLLRAGKVATFVSNDQMRLKFGHPTAQNLYYQLWQLETSPKLQFKWSLKEVCLLINFDYMSKESYAPFHATQRGIKVS